MLTKQAAKTVTWILGKAFVFSMVLVGAAVAASGWADILDLGQSVAAVMFVVLSVLAQTTLYDWPVAWSPIDPA